MKPESKPNPNDPGHYYGGLGWENTPDFTIAVTPALAEVSSPFNVIASYTVGITSLYGFDKTVNLSVTGYPADVEYSFTPGSIAKQGDSTLKITVNDGTQLGLFALTVTGDAGGGYNHSFPVQLSVTSHSRIDGLPKVPGPTFVEGPVAPPPGGPVEE
jgi:hypothetical protein